jgi:hypothetical protein
MSDVSPGDLSTTTWVLAYFDYHASCERYDVDALFHVEWCVAQRLSDHDVAWVIPGLFRNHAIVRLEGAWTLHALDGDNQLVALDHSTLRELIERDPSHVTGDLELAKRYAAFVDGPMKSRSWSW